MHDSPFRITSAYRSGSQTAASGGFRERREQPSAPGGCGLPAIGRFPADKFPLPGASMVSSEPCSDGSSRDAACEDRGSVKSCSPPRRVAAGCRPSAVFRRTSSLCRELRWSPPNRAATEALGTQPARTAALSRVAALRAGWLRAVGHRPFSGGQVPFAGSFDGLLRTVQRQKLSGHSLRGPRLCQELRAFARGGCGPRG